MNLPKLLSISILITILSVGATAQDFNWAKRAGGSDSDDAFSIVSDENGNNYVTGYFKGTCNFGEGSSQVSITSVGGADIYIAKYNTYGELLWVQQAGGSTGFDWGNAITLDSENNIFITGYFDTEATFGNGASAVTLTASGNNRDIFICKYNNSAELLWAYNAGGDENDSGSGLTVDASNNIYLVGNFKGSATFNSAGSITTISALGGSEEQDGFIAKYSNSGNLLWVEDYGLANASDGLSSIQLDELENIYVVGYRYTGSLSYYDPHIAKFDNEGTLMWWNTPTGVSNDGVSGIAIDQNGNSYIIGFFTIDIVFGDITLLAGNELDLTNTYITKYSADGQVIWAKVLPGTGGPTPHGGNLGDEGKSIIIDNSGYLYISGYMCGTTIFGNDCHTTELTSTDYKDIYVAKLNGNADLQWALVTGGANSQTPSELVLSNGNIVLCGDYQTSANIGGTYLGGYGGYSDIFIASIENTQPIISDYVNNLTASISNWAGNASDISINFNKAYTEETVAEYRAFLVKAAVADDFDVEEANSNTYYTTVIPDGSYEYSINPDEDALDSDGDIVAQGSSYIIFVLSLADGTIAQTNSLSCQSNEITIMYTNIYNIQNAEISIYPNPTNGIVTIGGKNILGIKVIDIAGRIIYEYEKYTAQIDLSEIDTGVYFIYIQTENNKYTEKLIIQ